MSFTGRSSWEFANSGITLRSQWRVRSVGRLRSMGFGFENGERGPSGSSRSALEQLLRLGVGRVDESPAVVFARGREPQCWTRLPGPDDRHTGFVPMNNDPPGSRSFERFSCRSRAPLRLKCIARCPRARSRTSLCQCCLFGSGPRRADGCVVASNEPVDVLVRQRGDFLFRGGLELRRSGWRGGRAGRSRRL
jgi:hypothetical protein